MAFVVAIVILVIITVWFHFYSPWWLTPIVSNWGAIDTTINITFIVTGIVFIAVNLFLAYAVYRFRYSKDRRSKYEPENRKLEGWLTGITAVGVAAMLTPGLFVWANFVTVPKEAHDVEVIGQQWKWSFRYPGKDGVLGAVDASFVSPENPFGMNPEDPFGKDDLLVESNEMHLPINQPVRVLLRSKDVLHDYAVAEFRVKMDMVPGSVSYLWLTPTEEGSFDILCMELCGIGHHVMRGRVVVDSQEKYDEWLAAQTSYDEELTALKGDPVQGQASYALCSTCHGANGEGNINMNAPKLAGQAPWYLRQQLKYFKEGVRGYHQDDTFGKQMAPMAATLVNDQAINNVVAYIQTLPDAASEATIHGDVANGQQLYEPTCGVCHGAGGQGVWSVEAPELKGMSDWYLARQLQNFKSGVRGAHKDDQLGRQMVSMVTGLKDDQAIKDVVAYINTLE